VYNYPQEESMMIMGLVALPLFWGTVFLQIGHPGMGMKLVSGAFLFSVIAGFIGLTTNAF